MSRSWLIVATSDQVERRRLEPGARERRARRPRPPASSSVSPAPAMRRSRIAGALDDPARRRSRAARRSARWRRRVRHRHRRRRRSPPGAGARLGLAAARRVDMAVPQAWLATAVPRLRSTSFVEDPAGAGLDEVLDASSRRAAHRLAPAHRADQRRRELPAGIGERPRPSRTRHDAAVRGGRNSTVASAARKRLDAPAPSPASGRRRATAQRAGRAGPRPRASAPRLDRAGRGPGDDELAGRVVVGDGQAVLVGERAGGVALAEQRQHPAAALRSAASLPSGRPARPRAAARRRRRAPRRRPARASSPSEWPAAKAAAGRPSRSQPASAGAVDRGLGEAGALVDAVERVGAESSSRASSSRSGLGSATSSRHAGLWLPWPGKRSAVRGAIAPSRDTSAATRWSRRTALTPRSAGIRATRGVCPADLGRGGGSIRRWRSGR